MRVEVPAQVALEVEGPGARARHEAHADEEPDARRDHAPGEARVEDAAARLSARGTALEIARNDMSAADPYETATKLQNVQLQLETHYTLTARLSRLSLTEYLR